MIAQRALAIAAAAMFVVTVAVATFGSEAMSLGQALYLLDASTMDKLLSWSNRVLGTWIWASVVQPLLVRPVWLLPASAGIICTGLSLSLFNRKSSHQSHRRS